MPLYHDVRYHQIGRDTLLQTRHIHEDCYELIQSFTDAGHIIIGGTLLPLERGGVCLLNGSQLHCSNPTEVATYERSKLRVDGVFLRGLLGCFGGISQLEDPLKTDGFVYYRPAEPLTKEVDSFFKKAAAVYDSGDTLSSEIITAHLLLLLPQLVKPECVTPAVSGNDTRMTAILAFLNEHLSQELSLDTVAAQLYINKYYLCRLFRKKTGLTLKQYLLERRLGVFRERLLTDTRPIWEIAAACGFPNASHVSRVFKAQFGMTPSAYKKRRQRDR